MLWPIDLGGFVRRQRRLGPLRDALPAQRYAAKVTDNADESATIRARIAFGCALLVTAGTAHHEILFAQIFRHQIRGLKLMNTEVIVD